MKDLIDRYFREPRRKFFESLDEAKDAILWFKENNVKCFVRILPYDETRCVDNYGVFLVDKGIGRTYKVCVFRGMCLECVPFWRKLVDLRGKFISDD